MARETTPTTRTIDLGRDQLLVLQQGGGHLRVLQGAAWLTEEGRAVDAFLEAGADWPLQARRTVVGAIATARLQVVGEAARRPPPLAAGWRRFVAAWHRQVTRLHLGPVAAPPCG